MVEVSRHKLSAHLMAVLAATGSMVTLSSTDPKETDRTALGAAVTTV